MQTSAFDHLSHLGLPTSTITTIGGDTTIERTCSSATIPNTNTVPVRRRTWAESVHLTGERES